MADECGLVRRDLGAFVLGTLSPADRAVVDRHLAGCAHCREELAGLAGLPALLQRVPVAEAALLGTDGPLRAPGDGLTWLLGRAARVRRRHRWQLAAVGVALSALTAASWALHVARQPSPASRPAAQVWAVTASGLDPATRDGAVVRYAPRPWGTQLEVRVTGIPAGTTCQLWATSRAGQRIPAGAWVIPAGRQHPWYPGATPIPTAGLSTLEIASAGQTLVTVRPGQAGPSARASPSASESPPGN